ncbi:MAG: Crp/Fnr family transcriptional regulator [Clostridia bacterium]|nr:Crp/Fnr family transcriptional regulator [Clostridia bacterium]
MKKYLSVLGECPLFAGIGEEDLLKMLPCLGATVAQFDKKYTIFTEGSSARHIGILLSGAAQVTQVDYYGNRSILTSVHTAEVFAEAFACAGVEALPVSVIATQPSEVMLIECSRILHTCQNGCAFHQRLIYNLMKDLATKTILFHQRADVISKRTTREKLMAYLMFYAKKTGTSSFEIPFDRQELADYLEVDRSGLSTEIGKLRNEGVLTCRRSRFTLL